MKKKCLFLPLVALAVGSACGDGSTTRTTEPQFAPGGLVKDIITNKIDATIDAVVEEMPLTVNGANGSTTLAVNPTGGDGKPGCNLTGSTTLVVSISSSNTEVATVAPASATFGSCGDVKTLTVTPGAQGTATITVSQTQNSTGGTFDFAPATFTVRVSPPPNTPPTILVTGVATGASYQRNSVPKATCQVTDAEDGSSSFDATLSAITGPYSADGVGSQTASCSYTDAGGQTVSASESYGVTYDDQSAPDIQYALDPAAPDGLNDWYKSDVFLVWTVAEGNSPASLVKTGCVDKEIKADQAATSYKCSASSAGGSAPEQTVTIKRDATAPTAAYTSASPAAPDGQNSWYLGDVTSTFTATDNLSGFGNSGSLTTTGTATTQGEGAAVTVASPLFTDNAGNGAASVNSANFKIDKTDPTASAKLSIDPNSNGWHNADVTVTFSGQDGESGLAGCDPAVTISNQGKNVAASGKCRDKAGRESVAATKSINLDKDAPTVAYTSASPSASSHGWYKQDVTATFTATDNLSGFDNAGTLTTTGTGTASGEGSNVEAFSPAFTDQAGNSVAGSAAKKSFQIDKTNPAVSLVGGPVNGSSYYFGTVPPAPTCNASDALSGLDGTCTVSGYDLSVGTHTVHAEAKDNADNAATASATYTVLPLSLKGFYQPVDMPAVVNTVKSGSTVPFKFEIFAGTTELTDPATSVKSFVTTPINCGTLTTSTDDIESTTTGGTSLRYDFSGGQFIQNWQTTGKASTCFKVTLTAKDEVSVLIAYFKLK
jgi:hypothetical protein